MKQKICTKSCDEISIAIPKIVDGKKIKSTSRIQVHTLIADLDLKEEPNWDWFILLVAKTGMRF